MVRLGRCWKGESELFRLGSRSFLQFVFIKGCSDVKGIRWFRVYLPSGNCGQNQVCVLIAFKLSMWLTSVAVFGWHVWWYSSAEFFCVIAKWIDFLLRFCRMVTLFCVGVTTESYMHRLSWFSPTDYYCPYHQWCSIHVISMPKMSGFAFEESERGFINCIGLCVKGQAKTGLNKDVVIRMTHSER